MPKKGKKLVFKTEEERLLYLQQRAQAEEELARKKKEMMFLYLQEKLRKEGKTTTLSELRLKEVLRLDMRIARTEQMQKSLLILPRIFQRKMDQMNYIVKRLLIELKTVQIQGDQVHGNHIRQAERFWVHMDVYLEEMQMSWNEDMEQLLTFYTTERARVLKRIEVQRIRLQDHILCTERSGREKSVDIENQFENMLLTTWNRPYLEELEGLEDLEDLDVLEDVEEEDEEDLLDFEPYTDKLERELMKARQEIKSDLRLFLRMTEKVNQMRADLMLAQDGAVEQQMKATMAILGVRSKHLREQLKINCLASSKIVARLSAFGDKKLAVLRALVAKGERVLLLGELCSKLERIEITTPPPVNLPVHDFENKDLKVIHEKVNTAILDLEVLRVYKKDLMAERNQLQFLLSQHSVLLDSSPMALAKPPPCIRAPGAETGHPVIEANHILRHLK